MTTVSDVANDPRYTKYLDHGFVALVEYMGSDQAIEESARKSYGKGTRKTGDRRSLIRFLMRHHHTSPFEMAEFRFHLKIPIAIMRQLVRHRTANLNEYSARYSELTDEFHVLEDSYIRTQSTANKQGSDEPLSPIESEHVKAIMQRAYNESYQYYADLISIGLSREQARLVMPVGGYTELYWKIDLKNLFHFLRLRMHKGAQPQIRQLADLIYNSIQLLVPLACEAWEDYELMGRSFSRMEVDIISKLLRNIPGCADTVKQALEAQGVTSQRELDEFWEKLEVSR